jgi:hypothetical protein
VVNLYGIHIIEETPGKWGPTHEYTVGTNETYQHGSEGIQASMAIQGLLTGLILAKHEYDHTVGSQYEVDASIKTLEQIKLQHSIGFRLMALGAVKLLSKQLDLSLTEQMINEDVEEIMICHMNRNPLLKFAQLTLDARAASLFQSLKKRVDLRKQTSEKAEAGSLTQCAALAEKSDVLRDFDKAAELYARYYHTDQHIEGEKRRVRDGTLVKRSIEPLQDTFVPAGPLTARTSLPTPHDYKVIAEEHHTPEDGEGLSRFMARIRPLPDVPDDWVELDESELRSKPRTARS